MNRPPSRSAEQRQSGGSAFRCAFYCSDVLFYRKFIVLLSRENMSPSCSRFLGIILAAVQMLALANVSLLTRVEAQERGSLAGQLLIASPRMTSPIFTQTVIIILRHESKGAMGVIINRPIGDRSLASLLESSGDKATTATGTVRIYGGGPIEPGMGFVIHTRDYQSSPTIKIDEKIAVTSSLEILRDIGRNRGPQKSLIAFGYAGWGPGQLEAELRDGLWFTTPEDPRLVFDESPDAIWGEVMK